MIFQYFGSRILFIVLCLPEGIGFESLNFRLLLPVSLWCFNIDLHLSDLDSHRSVMLSSRDSTFEVNFTRLWLEEELIKPPSHTGPVLDAS
ncbi:hypothetical protein F2Q70_00005085 [Brassica cretica]|uniref:Uncharacterized protein n=1 Tax=Brassica cretica TaxID=69181 RepID=A0A8S9J3U8_BRACR|nr:hypothetical protein F2Q70_00005085 [Brassica cretica]